MLAEIESTNGEASRLKGSLIETFQCARLTKTILKPAFLIDGMFEKAKFLSSLALLFSGSIYREKAINSSEISKDASCS